ncbi:uncharacterized protein LOC116853504 [Odontomachus brunneus]|uniref:uncharacterized protein LOC116853504 n=1 Tax=Odontomachus brunneus TaxID=486640 RepID=UPI0013F208F8|nr:uncharacterized protein LOC116853504 [Odontomachus brunneus]
MKQIFVRLNRKIMDRRETVINKKYSVVKFLIDNLYSEIPTSWLMHDGSKQLCLWPPRTANVASLIGNCISSNLETWDPYEVDVIKSCTSLESARRSAANSNYETTDEDSLGRGKRQHISNRYSSEKEEKEHNICRLYKSMYVTRTCFIMLNI